MTATANTVTGGLISTSTTSDDGASAYATVNLYDWAAISTGTLNTASTGNVEGGSKIANFYTAMNSGTISANGANLDITGSVSTSSGGGRGGGSQYADQTWRFNAGAAPTVTFASGNAMSVGSILVTPNVGANNVTFAGGGSSGGLRPTHANTGATGFMFWQNNTSGELVLNSANALLINGTSGSTTASYTQAGPGTVVLSAPNTYTGQNYLDGGVTEIVAD